MFFEQQPNIFFHSFYRVKIVDFKSFPHWCPRKLNKILRISAFIVYWQLLPCSKALQWNRNIICIPIMIQIKSMRSQQNAPTQMRKPTISLALKMNGIVKEIILLDAIKRILYIYICIYTDFNYITSIFTMVSLSS